MRSVSIVSMNATKLVLMAMAAALLSGCQTIPESARVPEQTWRAFEASGDKHNRLFLQNRAALPPETRATLGRVVVIAANDGPGLQAQRPLPRGEGAWRGAKLWLGWEKSSPAWRLARGRYQPAPSAPSSGADFLGGAGLSGSGDGAALVAIGYVLYMPVGGTIGAVSGAMSVPSKAKVERAMGVMSNAVARADLQRVLSQYLLAALQRGERSIVVHPELITSGERRDNVSTLEIKIHVIRLEGGVKPNPRLWLSVEWSAKLYSAHSSEVVYSTGGVWQSNEERVFAKWARDGVLEQLLHEACRQIAAVLAERVG
jgi:hypothetical protein